MDRISKLPVGIIETILCLLPIQAAARTSILSRVWRYRWITIPKLAFIQDTSEKAMFNSDRIFNVVYRVLLMHEGPIHEFTLSIWADNFCFEIDNMLHHLSRKNTVKKLTLNINRWYKLPLSLFLFGQLTDLSIFTCELYHQPTFKGFGNLTSLHLEDIMTTEKMLMHFLSHCPSLKSLNLRSDCSSIDFSDDFSVVDLFKCLPVIEDLSIRFRIIQCFQPHNIPEKLPTSLLHLRFLCMEGLSFQSIYGLPFLVLLIKSSPNLKKLKLEFEDDSDDDDENEASSDDGNEVGSVTLERCSNIWLEHLNELEILEFSNGKNELDFVKLILAKSPVLNKVRILFNSDVDKDDQLQIMRVLLRYPRASPVVDIIV